MILLIDVCHGSYHLLVGSAAEGGPRLRDLPIPDLLSRFRMTTAWEMNGMSSCLEAKPGIGLLHVSLEFFRANVCQSPPAMRILV